jgi:DNA polymerase (family 10)
VPLDRTLDQLAILARIRGDAAAVRSFSRASALVRAHAIAGDADLGPLLDNAPTDADPEVLRQLRYMYDAGAWVLLESAIADLPADLRWLFESGAVTIEQLGALHEALGITSAADLVAAVRREQVRRVPGLDAHIEAAVRAALPALRATIPRIPLGRAMALVDPVLACLAALPHVRWASPVGSVRRGQDFVGDIEVLAPTDEPGEAFAEVLRLPDIDRTLHQGPTRVYLLVDRTQIGVRCPPPPAAGAELLHLTGSIGHLDALARLAAERDWRIEPSGLVRGAGQPSIAETEEAIYRALDLPWIPPEIRSGADEIARAVEGRLPTLVARTDIRGDLHMHTDFSDGRDSVAAMVKACVELGYEYLAITDHSPRAASSRTLTNDSVKRQAEEIAALRARYPHVTILHGCEVDILADGRLDFSDRVLERFDIVLASLHEGLGHSPDQLLRRYVAAMRHPLVTLITHPTNRLIPYRAGYDLDYDRLFDEAVETGTIVEIDGAPPHLDMDGALARRAISAGVTVAIDSDCHRAEMLKRQMELGILTARRGWVEPRHVLNTRPIDEVRARVAAKRSR